MWYMQFGLRTMGKFHSKHGEIWLVFLLPIWCFCLMSVSHYFSLLSNCTNFEWVNHQLLFLLVFHICCCFFWWCCHVVWYYSLQTRRTRRWAKTFYCLLCTPVGSWSTVKVVYIKRNPAKVWPEATCVLLSLCITGIVCCEVYGGTSTEKHSYKQMYRVDTTLLSL